MIFPVAARELRVASRRRATYWNRTISAGTAFLICFWILVVLSGQGWRGASRVGSTLFQALFWFSFVWVLPAGARFTAAALSRERRDGTLGLLFLTDLKGYDVVMGKLAGTSLESFYSMLALLPVLAIPVLIGGVTIQEYAYASILLLNTLFFSLSLGLFASSFSSDERRSFNNTILLMLGFCLGVPMAAALLEKYLQRNPISDALLLACPCFIPFETFNGRTLRMVSDFWTSVIIVHVFAWTFLCLASRLVSRQWQDKTRGPLANSWMELQKRWLMGDAAVRKCFRKRLLEVNPIVWLCSREKRTRLYPWFFIVPMVLLVLWARRFDRTLTAQFGIIVAYFTHVILKCWVASLACHNLAASKASGSLELILSTPLTVKRILEGHWLSLKRQFLMPFLALATLELFLCLAGLKEFREPNPRATWILAIFANLILLFLDSFTLAWYGLWRALGSSSAQASTSITTLRVLIVPWLITLGLAITFGRNGGDDFYALLLTVWFISSLLTDLVLGLKAKQWLHVHFRTQASEIWQKPAETKATHSPETIAAAGTRLLQAGELPKQ
ncbi:MAG TPA: hypothetical protein VMZ27_00420 [Candidatus Saccharimonadales bacterium]|nr:hypothetical protein [Candidatus Saccharimonadales bacterium]